MVFSNCFGGDGSDDGHSELEAYVVCQEFVEDRLKAPATADFPGGSFDYTTHNGGGRYTVDAFVDSENSFGAQVRTDFVCVVQWQSGDTYRLESLDLQE